MEYILDNKSMDHNALDTNPTIRTYSLLKSHLLKSDYFISLELTCLGTVITWYKQYKQFHQLRDAL